MTGRDRDRIAVLTRRRDFLATRVKTYKKEGDDSRDKAELHALNWAIRMIEAADQHGILDDLYELGVTR